ncbi:hypothetical protein ACQ4PT_048292 [Festuca glaucescens]
MATPSSRPVPASVTLESFDALDCGVCCCPLRPPIFQERTRSLARAASNPSCAVGHVVCSNCGDKLTSAGNCHVCRAPIAGGYRRNHDMEKLVESIRVSCPNTAFGCTAKPAYYDYHLHLPRCLHPPCHCPAKACCFVGSTADLTDHFSTVHQWPRSKVWGSQLAEYILLDGFNVLDVIDGDRKHLLLLLVSHEHVGRAIAVIFTSAASSFHA